MRRLPWLAAAILLTALFVAAPARAAAAFGSTMVNQGSGNCAEVPDASSAVQLVQRGCSSAANQTFTFTPLPGSTDVYTIATMTAGSCVDIYGASTADNATVIQYACHSGTNQQFRLQALGTNTVTLVSAGSGKCVAPAAAGTGLVQLPCTTAASGVWRIAAGTSAATFTNPLSQHGPDPWLQYYNGFYHLATTTWNSTITMRKSRTLGGLASAPDTVLFTLTRPNGAGTMWAPEFHLLTGPNGPRWYLYYVAGREPYDLGTQRIHVLESAGTDPMGPYGFKADLLDPTQDNTWELDPSILQLDGKLYLLGTFYNGSQPNFIRPLSNPWTASGTRHVLSSPSYSWETVGGAVNEGAEVLQRNGKTFIVFSAGHCSTPDYKLGILTYNGGDPLQQSSWVKSPQPVFQRYDAGSVFGPGHNGFFKSPDGTEDWIVYHANSSANGGCDMNRTTRAQKFTWNADGTPNFGTPVALGTRLAVPSGEPAQ
ncbi:family 43 glycosylhydrolase [Amycolatopsis sp. A133]|uniref:family 43 glycosylhydrolase n=1 Tax=Amycolatopsis sp. A133 TaxID=3064472 RepID=UPI0027F0D3AF|nr:family 43 glycosylhydrolase [Amycolatopsis sp. A133]MDQ7807752.1 family 43 glycosylhydrolase [Amycolatopsis sp. A133]